MIHVCGNGEAIADTGPTKVLGVPKGRRVSNTISAVDHLICLLTFKYTILMETKSFLGRACNLFCGCRDRAVSFVDNGWGRLRTDAAASFLCDRDRGRRVQLSNFLRPDVSVYDPHAAVVHATTHR